MSAIRHRLYKAWCWLRYSRHWRPFKDNCEICHGAEGSVPGNENVIDGIVTCDYCSERVLTKIYAVSGKLIYGFEEGGPVRDGKSPLREGEIPVFVQRQGDI